MDRCGGSPMILDRHGLELTGDAARRRRVRADARRPAWLAARPRSPQPVRPDRHRVLFAAVTPREERHLCVGDVVEARVDHCEPYGLYLKHAGDEILVLVTELSWEQLGDPDKVFPRGARVRVKILRFIPEDRQFMGSIRRARMDESPYLRLAAAKTDD